MALCSLDGMKLAVLTGGGEHCKFHAIQTTQCHVT